MPDTTDVEIQVANSNHVGGNNKTEVEMCPIQGNNASGLDWVMWLV